MHIVGVCLLGFPDAVGLPREWSFPCGGWLNSGVPSRVLHIPRILSCLGVLVAEMTDTISSTLSMIHSATPWTDLCGALGAL